MAAKMRKYSQQFLRQKINNRNATTKTKKENLKLMNLTETVQWINKTKSTNTASKLKKFTLTHKPIVTSNADCHFVYVLYLLLIHSFCVIWPRNIYKFDKNRLSPYWSWRNLSCCSIRKFREWKNNSRVTLRLFDWETRHFDFQVPSSKSKTSK